MASPSLTVIDRQFSDRTKPQRCVPVSLLCVHPPILTCATARRRAEPWMEGRQGIEICQPTNEDCGGGKFAAAEPRTSAGREQLVARSPPKGSNIVITTARWSFCCRRPSPDANAGTPSSLPLPAKWQVWVSSLAGLDLPKELATTAANGDDDSNSNGN